jgi:hypothetical protein
VTDDRRKRLEIGAVVFAVVVLGVLAFYAFRGRGPYNVEAKELSGWTLARGEPGDPALVGLQPPAPLPAELFNQVLGRRGPALVAPAHPMVPLVLQSEYSDSLQGAYSIEDILDLARDTGVADARFEPVCVGQRKDSSQQLFYVVFSAPAFDTFRDRLTPLFQEHAGAVPYDPSLVRPILAVAATDQKFTHLWPVAFNAASDCESQLQVE